MSDEGSFDVWREGLEAWLVEECRHSAEQARAVVSQLPKRQLRSLGLALKFFKTWKWDGERMARP